MMVNRHLYILFTGPHGVSIRVKNYTTYVQNVIIQYVHVLEIVLENETQRGLSKCDENSTDSYSIRHYLDEEKGIILLYIRETMGVREPDHNN